MLLYFLESYSMVDLRRSFHGMSHNFQQELSFLPYIFAFNVIDNCNYLNYQYGDQCHSRKFMKRIRYDENNISFQDNSSNQIFVNRASSRKKVTKYAIISDDSNGIKETHQQL